MPKEYIEREAALEIINSLNIASALYAGRKIINLPPADVAPVRHGRWVNEQMIVGGFAETWACDCSVCGRTQREPLWKPNYCPNCGCRMDLEG